MLDRYKLGDEASSREVSVRAGSPDRGRTRLVAGLLPERAAATSPVSRRATMETALAPDVALA